MRQALRFTFYGLLPVSLVIQILGVTINPWVFLAQLQADFGGEFFLENTAALYDFRYTQIVGQLQSWSLANSDLAWWQPWGFDGLAFGLSLGLVLFTGWLLWRLMTAANTHRNKSTTTATQAGLLITLAVTYILLSRYYVTDRQFGPPDDGYTQALNRVVSQANAGDQIVTEEVRSIFDRLLGDIQDGTYAKAWIAEKGYDPKMGARPMARVIQQNIKKPLANELLFGALSTGGTVTVTLGADGELAFELDKDKTAA